MAAPMSHDLSTEEGDIFCPHINNIDVKVGIIIYLWSQSTWNYTTRVW